MALGWLTEDGLGQDFDNQVNVEIVEDMSRLVSGRHGG